MTALAGCTPRVATPIEPAAPPPDFALVLSIIPTSSTDDPALQAAYYVLEPDGTLRAAVGPGADDRLLPPPTARLTAEQTAELWQLTRSAGLVGSKSGGVPAPSRDPQLGANPVQISGYAATPSLDATVTAHGRRYRHRLDPPLDPAGVALLQRLARLRGD